MSLEIIENFTYLGICMTARSSVVNKTDVSMMKASKSYANLIVLPVSQRKSGLQLVSESSSAMYSRNIAS